MRPYFILGGSCNKQGQYLTILGHVYENLNICISFVLLALYNNYPGKCRYVPELGRFWTNAGGIGPEPAQFWHVYRVRLDQWQISSMKKCSNVENNLTQLFIAMQFTRNYGAKPFLRAGIVQSFQDKKYSTTKRSKYKGKLCIYKVWSRQHKLQNEPYMNNLG